MRKHYMLYVHTFLMLVYVMPCAMMCYLERHFTDSMFVNLVRRKDFASFWWSAHHIILFMAKVFKALKLIRTT